MWSRICPALWVGDIRVVSVFITNVKVATDDDVFHSRYATNSVNTSKYWTIVTGFLPEYGGWWMPMTRGVPERYLSHSEFKGPVNAFLYLLNFTNFSAQGNASSSTIYNLQPSLLSSDWFIQLVSSLGSQLSLITTISVCISSMCSRRRWSLFLIDWAFIVVILMFSIVLNKALSILIRILQIVVIQRIKIVRFISHVSAWSPAALSSS